MPKQQILERSLENVHNEVMNRGGKARKEFKETVRGEAGRSYESQEQVSIQEWLARGPHCWLATKSHSQVSSTLPTVLWQFLYS